jgi:hypothetical protein
MLNSFAHSKTKKKSAAAGENTTMGLFLVKKNQFLFIVWGWFLLRLEGAQLILILTIARFVLILRM